MTTDVDCFYENDERILPELASIGTNSGLKLKLDMKDNSKCITISLPTSTWSHCFVGIEGNSGSVHYLGALGVNNFNYYSLNSEPQTVIEPATF